ncbi:DUF4275 family protein [Priestia endophytica]|uniref:DUF4275 family protein n=1 Tax=Priestia endophytica DSM 13796 TaxID=1121089 RepID=A0A1I6BVA2_9BACI|nr:DUF4275 family protein [Priestia endophytica]KYG28727.1 ATP synthase F1 subunit delta [Priestia endophytica]SFQ84824.1 protein of unknown function [Priestia endophytica DSM 13796]
MELVDILKKKKVKVTEIPKWGGYLRKQWENNFANHMSEKEKKSIFLYDTKDSCGYLWHIFSYDKKKALKEEEAEKAFNNEPKDTCYIFYQHSDYALMVKEASRMTANDIIDETDIYVVNKDFNWTYVKTHETGWCGPYFSRKGEKL